MNNRKSVLFITVFTLIFSMVFSSVASADSISEEKKKVMLAAGEILPDSPPNEESVKIKKDQAIEIAKTMLDDASLYEVGNIFLNPKWGSNRSSWNVDFFMRQTPGGNANVTVDAETGEVIGFNTWQNYDSQQNFIAKITRPEARKIAEEFLQSKFKHDMDSYEFQKENPYAYGYRMGGVKEMVLYNFNYTKKINGVPLSKYNISVSVDGTTGKVRNYYCNRIDIDSSKLPSTQGILTADEAMNKYKDSVNVALQYITSYEEKPFGPSKPKVILAYVPSTYINMLDAVTGKAVNYDGSEIDMTREPYKQLAQNPVPMNPGAKLESKAVTEQEAKAIAEKYKAMVEGLFGITFDSNNREYYKPYYHGWQEDIWNFSWNINKNNENVYLNITINGKTGHVTNINIGRYNYDYEIQMKEGKKPAEVKEKANWKQGKEKAVELIKKIVPEQYGFFADQNVEELVFDEETKKYMREYGYSFIRVVNGLLYRDNNMNITIDRETGEMKNFYFNWSDLDFPSSSGIISKEEAAKKYFEGTEVKLIYFLQNIYDKVTGQEKFADAPKLVYSFNGKRNWYGNLIVDATTGKLVDWSGREIRMEASPDESQFPEHWAKRSTELLIAQGVIKNPYVDYDAELTRVEAVKMLSFAKGMLYYDMNQYTVPSFKDIPKDDEDYYYIENAIRQKILTETGGEFKGSEKITKEEFVRLLTNLMGFAEIAKKKDIYKVDGIKIKNPELVGSVAICYALDVLPVRDGYKFDGSEKVTYAEAAVALYKALSFIR